MERERGREVRYVAVLALGQISAKGDGRVIEALAARLKDNLQVRIAALQALAQIAVKGDRQAIEAVLILLQDLAYIVVAGATAQCAGCNGIFVLDGTRNGRNCYSKADGSAGAIWWAPDDGGYWKISQWGRGPVQMDWDYSQHAVDSDSNSVSPPLDAWAESRCSPNDSWNVDYTNFTLMEGDRGHQVRDAAMLALRHICEKGDGQVIEALTIRLQDRNVGVCRGAVQALEEIAGNSDWLVIAAVTAQFEDIRSLAVQVLKAIAENSYQQITEALVARLEDKFLVRIAAVQALAIVAQKGDQRIIEAVIARLEDVAHIVVVGAKRYEGGCNGIFVLTGTRNHRNCYSKEDGSDGAIWWTPDDGGYWKISYAGTGPSQTTWDYSQKAADSNPDSSSPPLGPWAKTRRSSSDRWHADYSDLMIAEEDRGQGVRHAAVVALGHLAQRGDGRVIEALAARLEDHATAVATRKVLADLLG